MDETIYVARTGLEIPGGWPADGRKINPLSALERRFVRDGDLVAKVDKPAKKDNADGK